MKVTVLVPVCQVTSRLTIALRYSPHGDLALIDAVGALKRGEQAFFLVLWFALQWRLMAADE